jgi:hypothetical protein
MDTHVHIGADSQVTQPWNKGTLSGAKPLLSPKHVWAIRTRLQLLNRFRDLALFNLAIYSKLRGCDLVGQRIADVAPIVMPLIEPPLDSAKREGRLASRSRNKPAKRSTTTSRIGVKCLVRISRSHPRYCLPRSPGVFSNPEGSGS